MDGTAATQYLAFAPPTAVSWVAHIGIIGGLIGGGLLHWLGVDVESGRRWFTFFVSLLGAVLLLGIVGMFRKTKT